MTMTTIPAVCELARLSDDILVAATERAALAENCCTAVLLAHLAEVGRHSLFRNNKRVSVMRPRKSSTLGSQGAYGHTPLVRSQAHIRGVKVPFRHTFPA